MSRSASRRSNKSRSRWRTASRSRAYRWRGQSSEGHNGGLWDEVQAMNLISRIFEAVESPTVTCLACPSPAETGWRVDSFGQVYGLCRHCSSKVAKAGAGGGQIIRQPGK